MSDAQPVALPDGHIPLQRKCAQQIKQKSLWHGLNVKVWYDHGLKEALPNTSSFSTTYRACHVESS